MFTGRETIIADTDMSIWELTVKEKKKKKIKYFRCQVIQNWY